MTRIRIGLYGGAFDPLHYGHIAVAEAAMKAFKLDRILWVPTGKPHHDKDLIASYEQRCQMLEAGLAYYSEWSVSRTESDTQKTSYTSETLKALCTDDEAMYITIIGADQAVTLNDWHQLNQILHLTHLAVAPRDEINLPEDCSDSIFKERWHTDTAHIPAQSGLIMPIPMTPININSTELRNNIQKNLNQIPMSIHHLLDIY